MKKLLNEFVDHYGNKKDAAKALGVTPRYITGLLNREYPPGKSLRKLLMIYLDDIRANERRQQQNGEDRSANDPSHQGTN
jgi:hypothetical protein